MPPITGWAAALVGGIGAFAVAASLGPWLAGRVQARGLLDAPDGTEDDARRTHEGALPRVGGIAVVVAFFAVAGLLGAASWELLLGLGAFAMGLQDDLVRTDARARLVAIVALAVSAWILGPRVEAVQLPGFGTLGLGPVGPVVTVLWIVGVVVAFDFLDGLDGLAGGVALAAAAAFTAAALVAGDPSRAVAPAVLAGALGGFLIHNRHPARIQLGDSGSNLVGFLIAIIALDAARAPDGSHALVAAGLALGVPILDAGLTVVRRLGGEGRLFESERGHLHHRLMDRGFSHVEAVRCLWGATAVGIAAGACTLSGGVALLAAGVAVPAVIAMLLLAKRPTE